MYFTLYLLLPPRINKFFHQPLDLLESALSSDFFHSLNIEKNSHRIVEDGTWYRPNKSPQKVFHSFTSYQSVLKIMVCTSTTSLLARANVTFYIGGDEGPYPLDHILDTLDKSSMYMGDTGVQIMTEGRMVTINKRICWDEVDTPSKENVEFVIQRAFRHAVKKCRSQKEHKKADKPFNLITPEQQESMEPDQVYYKTETINPEVSVKKKPVVTKATHHPENGVEVDRVETIEETVHGTITRDVTLCMTHCNGTIQIGAAIRNPKYDSFNRQVAEKISKSKAKKSPVLSAYLKNLPTGITKDIRNGFFYSVLKDMENDFGKYVAAFDNSNQ